MAGTSSGEVQGDEPRGAGGAHKRFQIVKTQRGKRDRKGRPLNKKKSLGYGLCFVQDDLKSWLYNIAT